MYFHSIRHQSMSVCLSVFLICLFSNTHLTFCLNTCGVHRVLHDLDLIYRVFRTEVCQLLAEKGPIGHLAIHYPLTVKNCRFVGACSLLDDDQEF